MASPHASPVPPTIRFERPPAYVTIGEALSIAARYWAASWERWVLAVVGVGVATGLAHALLGSVALDSDTLRRMTLPGGGGVDPAVLPRLLAGPLAVAIVSLVADWFLYANAIAGLRGRDVSLGWVLTAGLRTLLVLLALALVFSMATLALTALGPIGLLAMVIALPLLLYAGLRLQFWTLGVFDGQGVGAALRASWELTRGAVLRVLGWSLALVGLSLLVDAASTSLSLLFASMPIVPAIAGAVLGAAFQAFSLVTIAILYESQRGRLLATPPGGRAVDAGSPWRQPPASPSWNVDASGRPIRPAASDERGPDDPPAPPPPPTWPG